MQEHRECASSEKAKKLQDVRNRQAIQSAEFFKRMQLSPTTAIKPLRPG